MGDVYASNVMVAYDYALRMGAHVVSCSFGPKYPILQQPNSDQLAAAAQEVRLYEQAVRPMAQKGVLLVASAGNDLTDLDQLRDVNMPYLPCTLDLPNVVCVAASNSKNQIYREFKSTDGNRWTGTNTGPTTVHIAAPGSDIYSTVLGSNATGAYGYKSGSSMAAAIVSGAAALVLSVLGAADGSFYQAARARSLLLETGDPRPDLPVISGRTLNVGRAVQAAAELTRTVLQPMAVDVAAQSSVLLHGLTDSYFRLPPATAAAIAAAAASDSTATGPATTNGSVAAVSPVAAGSSSLLGLLPFDGSVRNASTCFSSFKYVGEDVMVAVRGHLKLPEAGQYGVRLATASPLARLAVTVGQRQMVWQAGAGGVREAVLLALQPEQLLQFQVTCSFCSLYVGDMLVLEVLDPANPAAGPLDTRRSSCLTLGPTASTPAPAAPLPPAAGARLTSATYPLQLRFATPNASISALVLQWAPCNSPFADFAPLAPLLAGGLWYRELAPPPAVVVGGGNDTMAAASTPPQPSMQCDAWDSSAVASPPDDEVAVLPRPEEVAPAYSFRLPSPNASSRRSCPGTIRSRCPSGSNLTFQIGDLYPDLLRSSEPLYLYVRCWAWWSSSFRGGLLTVLGSKDLHTAVYVAGQRVFYSVANNPQLVANRQPFAPNTTSLAGGYRQLLALEWHGVKSFAQLAVMDGSVDGEQTNATLLVANMFAPTA